MSPEERNHMRLAAMEAITAVGDGTWIQRPGQGAVYTSRAIVRVNKRGGDLSRNGYNGYNVLITMGTSASRRDRFTAAHMVASCPTAVLRLLDALDAAEAKAQPPTGADGAKAGEG